MVAQSFLNFYYNILTFIIPKEGGNYGAKSAYFGVHFGLSTQEVE